MSQLGSYKSINLKHPFINIKLTKFGSMRLLSLFLLVCIAFSQCHYSCNTCSTPTTNCTSCVPLRVLTGETCPCITGFYDSGASTCSSCSSTCLTCEVAATNCTSCVDTRTFGSNLCPCSAGYYEANAVSCPACDYTCKECSLSNKNCTVCETLRTYNSTSFTCPCSTGYFDVGVSTCSACNHTCLTCNVTATNCTSCNSLRTLTTNTCPCNAGYYENNVATCATCDYKCATCQVIATNCTSCGSTRTLGSNLCPCNAGLYDNGVAVCAPCNGSCATCDTSATNCLSCVATRNLTGNACPCQTGYYDVGVPTCAACNYTCLTCFVLAGNCSTCPPTRVIQGGTCPCDVGYFEAGVAACSPCHYSCQRCTGGLLTNCNSCVNTRALSSGSCNCITGYFDNGVADCAPCNYTCFTCNTLATNCTSCNTTRTLGSNACPCSPGFYDVGVMTCAACHYSCLTCVTNSTNCLTCDPTRTLNGSSCPCNTGLYDNGVAACAVCNYSCLTCSGTANNCTSCDTNRVLTNGTCPGSTGYYDAGVSAAKPCSVGCLTCSGASTNCLSCPATRTLVAGACKCNPGYTESGGNLCASNDIDFGYGVLLTLCWCLIADIAVLFKHLYSVKYRLLIHGVLMGFVVILSLCIMAAMIILRNAIVPSITQMDFQAHVVIVYITIVWMSLQLIIGLASRIMQANTETNPVTLLWVRRVHRYSGYSLMLLCKINVILWWALTNVQVALGIVVADVILILLLVVIYKLKYGKKMSLDQKEDVKMDKDGTVLMDPHIQELMKLPYNDPRVQRKRVVVFDDKVYSLPEPDFHPGGRKITKLMNGREIDRFLYGLAGPEAYPNLPPIEHPKNALALLGPPIGIVSNPTCISIPDKFNVSGELQVSQNISLFYFSPEQGRNIVISDQAVSADHLGTYFAVEAFGQTRLYWCVMSLLKSNRHLCKYIIDSKVKQSLSYEWEQKIGTKELSEEINKGSAKSIGQDKEWPLLIQEQNVRGSFTQMLSSLPNTTVVIQGPKGRGLCLRGIPPGAITVITSGSGLYPFLDLIDLIFKATVKHPSTPASELRLAESILARHSFTFFIQVDDPQQLIFPDELSIIAKTNNPRAQIFVKIDTDRGLNEEAFGKRLIKSFVINKHFSANNRPEMVYISGPPTLFTKVEAPLRRAGITSDRIFLV